MTRLSPLGVAALPPAMSALPAESFTMGKAVSPTRSISPGARPPGTIVPPPRVRRDIASSFAARGGRAARTRMERTELKRVRVIMLEEIDKDGGIREPDSCFTLTRGDRSLQFFIQFQDLPHDDLLDPRSPAGRGLIATFFLDAGAGDWPRRADGRPRPESARPPARRSISRREAKVGGMETTPRG